MASSDRQYASDRLTFENAVKRFARAQGITPKKRGAWAVLGVLLEVRRFKEGTAYRSRSDLAEDADLHPRRVKMALRALRDAGVIYPIAYEHGGRGCATIYKFRGITQNGDPIDPPFAKNPETAQKGGSLRAKTGIPSCQKGDPRDPPNPDSPDNHTGAVAPDDERRVAGRDATGDKAKRESARRLAVIMRDFGCDYGTARRHMESEGTA